MVYYILHLLLVHGWENGNVDIITEDCIFCTTDGCKDGTAEGLNEDYTLGCVDGYVVDSVEGACDLLQLGHSKMHRQHPIPWPCVRS